MLNGNLTGYNINITSRPSQHQYFMEWKLSPQQLTVNVTELGEETFVTSCKYIGFNSYFM